MKIGITSTGENLESNVDPRFGRGKFFLIVDTDSLEFEIISNESMMASGGAGIQAAQNIVKKDIQAVITGNIGPNAFQTLTAAGIKVYTGFNGTVKQALEKYKKGDLKETQAPSVGSHFGMG